MKGVTRRSHREETTTVVGFIPPSKRIALELGHQMDPPILQVVSDVLLLVTILVPGAAFLYPRYEGTLILVGVATGLTWWGLHVYKQYECSDPNSDGDCDSRCQTGLLSERGPSKQSEPGRCLTEA